MTPGGDVTRGKPSPDVRPPRGRHGPRAEREGGALAGIVVSLFTKPVAKEKLDNFYALIRTPIEPGEKVLAHCMLPVDAVVPKRRKIFPNTNLEIMIPSRTSLIGFLVGWACVAAIIYAVFLITKI